MPLALQVFAADGGDELALIPIFGSILGQEGEQDGWFRSTQNKIASASPLLTSAAPQFAYTAISQFIVPGSCPNIDVIGLTAFPALNLETVLTDKNSTQLFSVTGTIDASKVSLAYVSGQNLPNTVPITNPTLQDGKSMFYADFPFDLGFARGLTLAAPVKGTTNNFTSVLDVAAATLYAPALLEEL